jgi:hypothetical protein
VIRAPEFEGPGDEELFSVGAPTFRKNNTYLTLNASAASDWIPFA